VSGCRITSYQANRSQFGDWRFGRTATPAIRFRGYATRPVLSRVEGEGRAIKFECIYAIKSPICKTFLSLVAKQLTHFPSHKRPTFFNKIAQVRLIMERPYSVPATLTSSYLSATPFGGFIRLRRKPRHTKYDRRTMNYAKQTQFLLFSLCPLCALWLKIHIYSVAIRSIKNNKLCKTNPISEMPK